MSRPKQKVLLLSLFLSFFLSSSFLSLALPPLLLLSLTPYTSCIRYLSINRYRRENTNRIRRSLKYLNYLVEFSNRVPTIHYQLGCIYIYIRREYEDLRLVYTDF